MHLSGRNKHSTPDTGMTVLNFLLSHFGPLRRPAQITGFASVLAKVSLANFGQDLQGWVYTIGLPPPSKSVYCIV